MTTLGENFAYAVGQISKYVPIDVFNYSLNISLKHRYVYVETPKVACSTIKLTLQKFEIQDPDFVPEDFEDIHNRNFSPLLGPTQVGPLKKFLHRRDIIKFCFVRNPYTRLLSCYLDKIAGNKPHKSSILRQLGDNPSQLEIPISFQQFIDAVAQQPITFMDPHWRPQYYQTFQDTIKYNIIGKFERFHEDFTRIANSISEKLLYYYHHEHRHQTNAMQFVREYYNDEIAEKVFNIYKVDFDAFNYPKELPVYGVAFPAETAEDETQEACILDSGSSGDPLQR